MMCFLNRLFDNKYYLQQLRVEGDVIPLENPFIEATVFMKSASSEC